MSLLTRVEKQQLINLLLQLPNINDPSVRQLLIADLPQNLQTRIPPSESPALHIANIIHTVDSDTWAQLPDGSWSILSVIENAIYTVQGSRLTTDLQALLDALLARAAAVETASHSATAPTTHAALTGLAAEIRSRPAPTPERSLARSVPILVGGVVLLLLLLAAGVLFIRQPPGSTSAPSSATTTPPLAIFPLSPTAVEDLAPTLTSAPSERPPSEPPPAPPTSTTTGLSPIAFSVKWGRCQAYVVLPGFLNPRQDPQGAATALKQARNPEDGRIRGWALGVMGITPSTYGFEDLASVTANVTNSAQVMLPSTVTILVRAQPNATDHIDLIHVSGCGAGGEIRVFSDVPLETGNESYSRKATTAAAPFFTLMPGEFEVFDFPFECKTPGTYSVAVDVPYTLPALNQSGQATRNSPQLICPDSYSLWEGQDVLLADPNAPLGEMRYLGDYKWNGTSYDKSP